MDGHGQANAIFPHDAVRAVYPVQHPAIGSQLFDKVPLMVIIYTLYGVFVRSIFVVSNLVNGPVFRG
jgi:hypothetical protein